MDEINVFASYYEVETKFSRIQYVEYVLSQLIDEDLSIDVNLDLIRHHFDSDDSLTTAFHHVSREMSYCLRNNIRIDTSLVSKYYFYGLLYLALLEPDNDIEDKSPCLQVLNVFMKYVTLDQNINVFYEEKFVRKLFGFLLTKLERRIKHKSVIPSQLLVDLKMFLIQHRIVYDDLKDVITFLLHISLNHLDMLTDLTIYDKNCKPTFLAFVCLASIMERVYTDVDVNYKTNMIICFFTNIVSCLNKEERNLTPIEKGILESNYRSFVRQVFPLMDTEAKIIVSAMASLARALPKSKELIFLINQLPFLLYYQTIKVIEALTKKAYDPYLQSFCFNAIESLYITEYDENIDELNAVTLGLIQAIIWSIKIKDFDTVLKTVRYLYNLTSLQDQEIVFNLKIYLLDDKTYFSKILNFIYQHCDIKWVGNRKEMNQYFILIFCKIYHATHIILENNFEQVLQLIQTADLIDLIPCINAFVQYLRFYMKKHSRLTEPILKTMVNNANVPHVDSAKYVQALYNIMFVQNEASRFTSTELGNLMFSYNVDMVTLIKKMTAQRLITPQLISLLIQRLINKEDCWRMLSIIMPLYSDMPLPQIITQYWVGVENTVLDNDKDLKLILETVLKLVDLKTSAQIHERQFLKSLVDFLMEKLEGRCINLWFLGHAILGLKRLLNFLRGDIERVKRMCKELEAILEKSLTDYIAHERLENIKVAQRDINYFSELCLAFGNIYKPRRSTVELLRESLALINLDTLDGEIDVSNGCSIIRCAALIFIRHEEYLPDVMQTLKQLIQLKDEVAKSIGINSLYDITLARTGNFEMLVPMIHELMLSPSPYVRAQGVIMFMKLMKEEHIVPVSWQFFTLIYALTDNNVNILCCESLNTDFCSKHESLITKYFVHALFFFNKYYAHKQYKLNDNLISMLPHSGEPLESKLDTYAILLKGISSKNQMRILTEIFKQFVLPFHDLSLRYPMNFEILQDVLHITYTVMCQKKIQYPKQDQQIYNRTIQLIEMLLQPPKMKKKMIVADSTLIQMVLKGLLNIAINLEDTRRVIFPEIYHVILAICDWHEDTIKMGLSDEGPNGTLRKILVKINYYYKQNQQLFHFEIPLDPDSGNFFNSFVSNNFNRR